MVDRISTAMLHQQNLRDMSKTMLSLNKLNMQISSGKKADTYVDLNGNIERVVGYQTKLNKIDNYISNNNAAITRLETISASVTSVQKIAGDFKAMLTQWKSSGNERGNSFKQQAEGMLDQVIGQLNVSIEGRYLFGGSRTDGKPVSDPIPDPVDFGKADDNYYQGDNSTLSVRASDTYEVAYSEKANDPAFQELIGAIKAAIKADDSDDSSMFDKASDLATQAISDLTTVTARVSGNILGLKAVNDQHTDIKAYLKPALAEETDTDIAAASIQLAVEQTVLQATFQTFARLSTLRLTEYLN